jgi:hypothetical protein
MPHPPERESEQEWNMNNPPLQILFDPKRLSFPPKWGLSRRKARAEAPLIDFTAQSKRFSSLPPMTDKA